MLKEALLVWRNKITSKNYVSYKKRALLFTITSINITLVIIFVIRLVSLDVSSGELCARDAVIHVLDVFTLSLKVCCCIIGARDKDLSRKTQSRALWEWDTQCRALLDSTQIPWLNWQNDVACHFKAFHCKIILTLKLSTGIVVAVVAYNRIQ